METDLILTDNCLSTSAEAQDNLARVAMANRVFELGIEETRLSRLENIAGLMGWFSSDMFLGLSFFCDLLYDMEENGGAPVDAEARVEARQLRALGWPDMARLIDEYFDVVAATPRDAARPDQEESRVAGSVEVEAALEHLRAEWRRVIADALNIDVSTIYSELHGYHFVPDALLHPVFLEKFNITVLSQDDFETYWTQLIQTSDMFQRTHEVQERLGRDLTGPLTDKLIGGLSAKGYHTEFVFWQTALPVEGSEVGARSRGYIYLQTSRGPIRLLDRTDEVSMRTYYPVDVEELNGRRRFSLQSSADLGRRKSGWIADMLRGFAGQN